MRWIRTQVAETVSGLVVTCERAEGVAADVAAAVAHAHRQVADGSRVATLVVPHDVQRTLAVYDAAAVASVQVTQGRLIARGVFCPVPGLRSRI